MSTVKLKVELILILDVIQEVVRKSIREPTPRERPATPTEGPPLGQETDPQIISSLVFPSFSSLSSSSCSSVSFSSAHASFACSYPLPIPPTYPSSASFDPLLTFLAPTPTSFSSLPAFTELPTFDTISTPLCKVIKAARRIPCGNPSSWKPAVQNRWNFELNRLAEMFDAAIANPTELNLFNAVHNFVCAPGTVLAPFFSDIHHKDNGFDLADSVVSAALRKVLKGQERKAMKLLCSYGVAKVTPETVTALKVLHPQVAAKDIADTLFLEAGDFSLAKDVYGWAPWLFFSCRGANVGFFRSFTHFACFLANNSNKFPTICSALISAGALTPLNKVTEEERKMPHCLRSYDPSTLDQCSPRLF